MVSEIEFNTSWNVLGFENEKILSPVGERPLRRCIILKDAYEELNIGLPHTAEKQALEFVRILRYEAERSNVLKELIIKIVQTCSRQAIILYFGQYSSACFDSAPNWCVDLQDYSIMPSDPLLDPLTGDVKGHTQGEMIIHILEERLYMTKPGKNFTESHLKCFLPTSYQNRYRKEMGLTYDAISFDLHQIQHNFTYDEISNWEGVDAGGNLLNVLNIHTGKMLDPYSCNYVPSNEQLSYTRISIEDFISKKIECYTKFCQNDFQENQTVENENAYALSFWIDLKYQINQEIDNSNANQMKLELLGPYTIGFARKKVWNMLRVQIRERPFPLVRLIEIGNKTFHQNHKINQLINWMTIECPNESEIQILKEKMRNTLQKVHLMSLQDANTFIDGLSQHF